MVSLALLPASWIYCLLVLLRRRLYRWGILTSTRLPVPVIIIGNITVGGTGKTPLVIWLARQLQGAGYRPGIVSRGYGGRARSWPREVGVDSDPDAVGDEPILLARHGGCPVVAGPDRLRAARMLLRGRQCDVIISDDGLQHYALRRDIEIVVIDGERRFGNGHCLPAGPLREPAGRLQQATACVINGIAGAGELGMSLAATAFRPVDGSPVEKQADFFLGQRLHAVAGIGNPGRFFGQLRGMGLDIMEHPFPDHYRFVPGDIQFPDDAPVIMTGKDAVKCEKFADKRHWYLQVEARPDPALNNLIMEQLREKNHG